MQKLQIALIILYLNKKKSFKSCKVYFIEEMFLLHRHKLKCICDSSSSISSILG